MSDSCMIFFQSDRCDMNRAIDFLQRSKLTVHQDGNSVAAGKEGGLMFPIALVKDAHVQADATEISANTEHAEEMAKCDARFNIIIDNLAQALDEINTLMQVQGALQDASLGYLFTPWNGNVTEPWID